MKKITVIDTKEFKISQNWEVQFDDDNITSTISKVIIKRTKDFYISSVKKLPF